MNMPVMDIWHVMVQMQGLFVGVGVRMDPGSLSLVNMLMMSILMVVSVFMNDLFVNMKMFVFFTDQEHRPHCHER